MNRLFNVFFVIFLSFIIFAVFSSSAHAVEKERLLNSDVTQKKYERKAVIGLEVGLSKKKLKLKLECPVKVCGFIPRKFTYFINEDLREEISQKIYDWIITQRFDKIVITPKKAYIITAKKIIGVNKGNIPNFSFGVGDYKEFKRAVEEYLNTKLSPIVEKLMSSALEQRYKELPEKEQETFITLRAKELGIPVEVARRLMNSAFVFAVYVKFKDKNGYISCFFDKENLLLGKGPYHTDIEVPTEIKVLVYKFNADKGKFMFYKEFKGSSGFGVSESQDLFHPPRVFSTEDLFEKSLIASIKASGISVNTVLKADENFAIYATVDELGGNWFYRIVKSDIGVLEDLRVDAPYWVREDINGKMVDVGFIKARKVFINCNKRGFSEFQLIRGGVGLKDQLKEHPWTGLLIYLEGGQETYKLTKFDIYDMSSGGGTFSVFKIGANLDLGYALNSPDFSEVWFDIYGGLGFGGKKWKGTGNGTNISTDSPLYVTAGFGLYKRLYFTSLGIYLGLGGDIGYNRMWTTDKITGDDYSVYSVSIKPMLKLGYTYSPDFEMSGYIGYNLPFFSEGKLGKKNVDATAKGGIVWGISINFHSGIVGAFSEFYTKPSDICRKELETGEI